MLSSFRIGKCKCFRKRGHYSDHKALFGQNKLDSEKGQFLEQHNIKYSFKMKVLLGNSMSYKQSLENRRKLTKEAVSILTFLRCTSFHSIKMALPGSPFNFATPIH